MPQKFNFTTTAMAAGLEETSISYEELAAIENDFEEVEVEIIRVQIALTAPVYARREAAISKLPSFWPLVLEQAPPDIDQYIQPSDSAILLTSLISLSVSHFEASDPHGDPRSISIKFSFAENEYFENRHLEKKFWYRKNEGWGGLVSEPVSIQWKKKEKDLTGGLLDLVCEAWEEEKARENKRIAAGEKKSWKGFTPAMKLLKKKIEGTAMSGSSFFAFFGFIGSRVSKEEDQAFRKLESENEEKRKKGEKVEVKEEEEDEDDEGHLVYELEIFPDGDDLAVSISEDLWPGAIKYFTQAQEMDALSDLDFESSDDLLDEANISDLDAAEISAGEESDSPPSKKQKK